MSTAKAEMPNDKTMQKLEDLVEEIEVLEPTRDSDAYIRRELLAALDRAHEMLACLIADAGGDMPINAGLERPVRRKKKGSE